VSETKTAESQGKFQYDKGDSINMIHMNGEEVKEKEKPMFAAPPTMQPKSMPDPYHIPKAAPAPAQAPLIPVPAAAPTQAPVLPQGVNLNDEFLDPELDLDLEGMNFDGDIGVSISAQILI